MSEMTVARIPLDRIRIGNRLRDLNADKVAVLVESIAELGLLHPITVCEQAVIENNIAVSEYLLVAGAHRTPQAGRDRRQHR
jgi:ParB-like chromosome segregation protein Spo0J